MSRVEVVYGHLNGDGTVKVHCPSCRQWHTHELAGGASHARPCDEQPYRVVLRIGAQR